MSNTRRVPGTIPAAFSATGKDVPPSPDVAERNLAEVIGEGVALHLAKILGPLLNHMSQQMNRPGCLVCAAKVKRAEREFEIQVANAKAAAEAGPDAPDIGVTESFTDGARGPVCWGCYDPDIDGPYDLADYLPPATD